MNDAKIIQVCESCFTASCWYNEFMCEKSKEAGLTELTIRELKKLNLEHEENWSDEKMQKIYGSPSPFGNSYKPCTGEGGIIMYPQTDNQYEETTIKSVKQYASGSYEIVRDDGWLFLVENSPIEPLPGMTIRFYGKGIGSTVRGLFIEGQKVFYRNEEEDKIHLKEQMYGKDVKEWLDRWDKGHTVWSVEMGGMGPGYEQAIQVTVAEILRHLIEVGYDIEAWNNKEQREKDSDKVRKAAFQNEVITNLGLSGAQYGVALNLATILYKKGPINVLSDPIIKDRKIQVSKNFPS